MRPDWTTPDYRHAWHTSVDHIEKYGSFSDVM